MDWVCRAVAVRAMLDADLPQSLWLFVNVEADSLMEPCPDDLQPTICEAGSRLRVFIDIAGVAMLPTIDVGTVDTLAGGVFGDRA